MDVISGASSFAAVYASMGLALSGPALPAMASEALAMQAAAMDADATLMTGLLASLAPAPAPAPAPSGGGSLASAMAGLSVLDPGAELARLSGR
jgi:hypothetical protein